MNNKMLQFFLGALSPTGFGNYYTQVLSDTSCNVVLLKGSPGCGKSTLMRRVANYLLEREKEVEIIYCASDPDSIDGVICKECNFAIVDATAPHVLEPAYPIAFEQVMPLYYCIDAKKLRKDKESLMELFDKYTMLTERVTRYLAAAGSLLQDTARVAQTFTNVAKAHELARALARRYLPAYDDKMQSVSSAVPQNLQAAQKGEQIRLLSAVTWKGVVGFEDTVPKLADDIVVLDDAHGCAAKAMLYTLRKEALKRNLEIITCYCSMSPYDKIEHLIIPSQRLAFVTSNAYHKAAFKNVKEDSTQNIRKIHCTRFYSKEAVRLRKNRLKFNRKATEQLLLQAQALCCEAKACHDEIEKYYKHAADYPALDRAYEKIVAAL